MNAREEMTWKKTTKMNKKLSTLEWIWIFFLLRAPHGTPGKRRTIIWFILFFFFWSICFNFGNWYVFLVVSLNLRAKVFSQIQIQNLTWGKPKVWQMLVWIDVKNIEFSSKMMRMESVLYCIQISHKMVDPLHGRGSRLNKYSFVTELFKKFPWNYLISARKWFFEGLQRRNSLLNRFCVFHMHLCSVRLVFLSSSERFSLFRHIFIPCTTIPLLTLTLHELTSDPISFF